MRYFKQFSSKEEVRQAFRNMVALREEWESGVNERNKELRIS